MQLNVKLNVQKKQKNSYSGKKKCHTIKDQIVIDGFLKKIICVVETVGSTHDFELFKQSKLPICKDILVIVDKGYLGICNIHKNTVLPYKKSKKHPLTLEQKRFNHKLSKIRIVIEHVNRRIKRFKILQLRYRNKQRKHLLIFSLICGIYNFELRF